MSLIHVRQALYTTVICQGSPTNPLDIDVSPGVRHSYPMKELFGQGSGQSSGQGPAHLHDSNVRGVADGRQAMCNHDGGAPLHAFCQGILHQALAFCIQRTRRLQQSM